MSEMSREEKLKIKEYDEAARVIHLHLNKYCDESLPFPAMVADAAREANKDIELFQKQNKELIETLKFYADGDNWGHIAPDKVDYRVIEESDFGIGEFQLTELTDDEWVGGRRAREVLAKFSKGI